LYGSEPVPIDTVLAVFAHPDDESLACGGTLACLSDLGAAVVLLCASRGESGDTYQATVVTPDELARLRCDELHAAARALGMTIVKVLDHPDGCVRWANPSRLRLDILDAIKRFNPDLVITFDDDGLYWHADHIGVHEGTSDAVATMGNAAPPLYYATMANGAMSRVVESARGKRWIPPSTGFWSIDPGAFGMLERPSTFFVDTRPWMPRKLAALKCHRSQMGSNNPFSLMTAADARKWLGVECFRRAPIGDSPSNILEQLAIDRPLLAARSQN
jgi:LmbE family N-acetylglucosaminyl deacetylase